MMAALRHRLRISTAIAGVSLALSLAGEASAQPERAATARQLANQGIDAIEAGNCDKGIELLTQAEEIYHAPVHLRYIADCHEKRGRLLLATEAWRKIVRDGVDDDTPEVVVEAVREAEAKLERTLPLLATAKLAPSQEYTQLELVLDGDPLDAALIGAPQVMDPGEHELVARASGYNPKTIRWNVESGESINIDIRLTRDPSAPEPDSAQTTPEDGPATATSSGSALRTVGYVALATGGASLVGGTVTMLMRNSRRSDLKKECGRLEGDCDPDAFGGDADKVRSEQNAVEDLNLWTNVLLFGGGAVAATGLGLLLFSPSDASAPQDEARRSRSPLVAVSLTPQGAAVGVSGTF